MRSAVRVVVERLVPVALARVSRRDPVIRRGPPTLAEIQPVASVPLVALLLLMRKSISRLEGGILLLVYLIYIAIAIVFAVG
jgi:hypothetical protein